MAGKRGNLSHHFLGGDQGLVRALAAPFCPVSGATLTKWAAGSPQKSPQISQIFAQISQILSNRADQATRQS
jgi:hypothetical protein